MFRLMNQYVRVRHRSRRGIARDSQDFRNDTNPYDGGQNMLLARVICFPGHRT